MARNLSEIAAGVPEVNKPASTQRIRPVPTMSSALTPSLATLASTVGAIEAVEVPPEVLTDDQGRILLDPDGYFLTEA